MQWKRELEAILQKYDSVFQILEEYDRTWELPDDRVRLDITMARNVVDQLHYLKATTSRSISSIIEEAVVRTLSPRTRRAA